MCGIAGAAPGIEPELLRRMTEQVAHRGPDGEGYWCQPEVTRRH
jgi:asparagine synthase (glutamine-hydrolysing)